MWSYRSSSSTFSKSFLTASFRVDPSIPTWYHNLPIPILLRIFGYFSQKELKELMLVCQQWKFAAQDPSLWRSFTVRGHRVPMYFICKKIRSWTKLETVHADNILEPAAVIRQVCRCIPGVKHLAMRHCTPVPESAIRFVIKSCSRLESLDLSGTPVKGTVFYKELAGLTKLKLVYLKLISDDEDKAHPNIDTPSLFCRRRHVRLERMEEHRKNVENCEKRQLEYQKKYTDAKEKLSNAEKTGAENLEDLKKVIKELEKEGESIKQAAEELKKKEKKQPWYIDNVSKPGYAKTVIDKKAPRPRDENLTEEEREARMKSFIKRIEKELKHFGMLRIYDDSRAYLKAHDHLVCEDAANYLVIWCINLEMEEQHDLMEHVAHQTICMQYILELAKQLDYDPRACLDAFFSKIQVAEPEYKASFEDELKQFKERIRRRAAEKVEEAVKESEEEERKQRLGPGGLYPLEVFESLPEELKKCFESQDIGMLQEAISKMDEQSAKYHMKRSVDSGLWVPDAKKGDGNDDDGAGSSKTAEGTVST